VNPVGLSKRPGYRFLHWQVSVEEAVEWFSFNEIEPPEILIKDLALVQSAHDSRAARRPEVLTDPPTPANAVPVCPVTLAGTNEQPIVNGVAKEPLTPAQFRVVEALVAAYPERIAGDSLARKSQTEAPVKIIDRLRRDPDWAEVLFKPGKAHGGYAIVPKTKKVGKSRGTRRGRSSGS
jgi:hypothetical protein